MSAISRLRCEPPWAQQKSRRTDYGGNVAEPPAHAHLARSVNREHPADLSVPPKVTRRV